jgi:hypothetical protein
MELLQSGRSMNVDFVLATVAIASALISFVVLVMMFFF